MFIEYKYNVNFTLCGRGVQVACVVRPLWYGAAMKAYDCWVVGSTPVPGSHVLGSGKAVYV